MFREDGLAQCLCAYLEPNHRAKLVSVSTSHHDRIFRGLLLLYHAAMNVIVSSWLGNTIWLQADYCEKVKEKLFWKLVSTM